MVEILTLLIRILILVNSCRSNWLDQGFLSAHVIIFAYFIAIRSYGSGLYFSRSEIDLSFFMFSQDVIYSVSDGLQLRISSSLSGRAGVGPKFRMFGFHRRSLFNLQLINSLPNYKFLFKLISPILFDPYQIISWLRDLNINYTNKYMCIKWKRYFYLLYWNRAINMVSSRIKRLFASIGGVSG